MAVRNFSKCGVFLERNASGLHKIFLKDGVLYEQYSQSEVVCRRRNLYRKQLDGAHPLGLECRRVVINVFLNYCYHIILRDSSRSKHGFHNQLRNSFYCTLPAVRDILIKNSS
jgi:hypothetical protein